ncbi:glycosyltransferase family 4 protein [Ornithinimicrobium pekingense]|uniref:Glycosyltransferase subfamily 4-like N-terminal domain-containing protein n=1 Tax=Ornithinimicrobium pekingense TaxID=384677 RepID=A0ABQ2F6U1_9MICO|nr:glycosyltransferase family 4 protein [Ornithinimicrobium pekingense]GGK67697.1 hypothetical protein GCM10011509_15090 [Ornithinimicrobium pekingense]
MPQPAILMMVGNDIRHDTRVLKTALALADGGAAVTILGHASSGFREDARLGDVRILRVPVAFRFRSTQQARKVARRRARLVPPPADLRTRNTWGLRSTLLAKEAHDLGGWSKQARSVAGKVERKVRTGSDRVVTRLGRREDVLRESWWEWWDAHAVGATWRREVPELFDYELAFAPVIDELEWDVIHAHDVHLMGTASRAVARRRATGRSAEWVYDAHEFVAGLSQYAGRTGRRIAGYLDAEQEYVRQARAVVTVTTPLAEELQRRYDLPTRPTVVMNAPPHDTPTPEGVIGIREVCELEPDVPLMVYSGAVTAARGIHTAVDALPDLPDVHLAVVCVPHTNVAPARQLTARAAELGVQDRLHLVEPVAPDAVTEFVASADVGIIPLRHFGSHEFALANKLFEYLFAGLPVLVSDCRAQADFVRDHHVGGVHVADDQASFATELRSLLGRRTEVRRHIAEEEALLEPYHWEHQARALRDLYRGLLGADALAEPARTTVLTGLVEGAAPRDDRPSVVGIGPANMAGQATAWAQALETHVPGLRTHVTVVDRNLPLLFPGDETVPSHVYARDKAWAQKFQATAQQEWTHALLEAGRPLFGLRNGRNFAGDARVLRAVGIRVGLILHGSEVRDPRRHAALTPWSPFVDPEEQLTAQLQTQRDALWARIDTFLEEDHGPVFVSTPDLLADAPGSLWLPVVVDPATWTGGSPAMDKDVPVVLHAPSRASLKGSASADEVLTMLDDRGLVEYRRVEGVPPAQMPAAIRDADIVLDQFALGSYGAMACQAMAAGRVVLGHVLGDVRDAAGEAAGMPLPIVETTPDTLAEVIEGLVTERDRACASALAGPAFVEAVHDGALSAQVLVEHMGLRGD